MVSDLVTSDKERFGRSLTLYLVNGSPTGIITAELGNWSGKALKSPRSMLPNLLKERDETSQTGIYLLVGNDLEYPERKLVYVGESDNVRERLRYHDKDEDKQFFTRVGLFVSKDVNLTKAHVRHLESRLIKLIREAGRAKLINSNNPVVRGLPEFDFADMEGFLTEVRVLLPVLDSTCSYPTVTITQRELKGHC